MDGAEQMGQKREREVREDGWEGNVSMGSATERCLQASRTSARGL
jgi:hypothetical protein